MGCNFKGLTEKVHLSSFFKWREVGLGEVIFKKEGKRACLYVDGKDAVKSIMLLRREGRASRTYSAHDRYSVTP